MVKKGLFYIIFLGLLFLALSHVLGLKEGPLEVTFSTITYPFLVVQKALVSPFIAWRDRRDILNNLLIEFEALCKQRDELSKEVIELKALLNDTRATAEMRTFLKRYNTDYALMSPILLKNFKGTQFFLLDAGLQAGICPDMIAVYNNCLVGKVTHVYPYYCKVVLITDPSCKVAAYCTTNGVKGIHEGHRSGKATLNFVDHRDPVHIGDLVISSGEGGLFPRGFALGRITHADNVEYGRSIVLDQLIDFSKIDYCCVMSNRVSSKDLSDLGNN